jgi:hypothetical protein
VRQGYNTQLILFKLIELKKADIKIKEAKIQALTEMIDTLEETINDQGRRLDVLNLSLT